MSHLGVDQPASPPATSSDIPSWSARRRHSSARLLFNGWFCHQLIRGESQQFELALVGLISEHHFFLQRRAHQSSRAIAAVGYYLRCLIICCFLLSYNVFEECILKTNGVISSAANDKAPFTLTVSHQFVPRSCLVPCRLRKVVPCIESPSPSAAEQSPVQILQGLKARALQQLFYLIQLQSPTATYAVTQDSSSTQGHFIPSLPSFSLIITVSVRCWFDRTVCEG